MKQRQIMNKKDLAKFIIAFLGIKEDIYIVNELIEDLVEIDSPVAFKAYIKEKFNYEKYKYLKDYAKFTAIKNDFIKESKPKLTAEQDLKVRSYSEKLFSRVTTVFDEIDYRTKIGMDIQDKRISRWIYQEFGEDEKALQILNKIGKREQILEMLRRDRQGLEDKIKNIVHNLTMAKTYPQLENKSNDKNVLAMLANKA